MIKRIIKFIKSKLDGANEERIRFQFLIVYIILGTVSLVMTLINFITGYKLLMFQTLFFSIGLIINIILFFINKKCEFVARLLFFLEIIALFTSFVIIGEPEGFAAIWCALLPACGLLLYGKKYGSILSLIMLLILMFFYWIPFGNSLLRYEYTESFKLRFPILYIAFFSVGLVLETILVYTQNELNKSKEKYKKLSYHDGLTGLLNERSYFEEIEKLNILTEHKKDDYIVMVMDLNGLKLTNDKYGHHFGCHLVVLTGQILQSIFKDSLVFHVGGDEFQAIIKGEDLNRFDEILKEIDEKLLYRKIDYKNHELLLSVAYGYARSNHSSPYHELFEIADKMLYANKKEMKKKYNIPNRANTD
jgi:diguanylate cyclase (GGDEF)-like protein